jgi:predicted HTH domain antitoxin
MRAIKIQTQVPRDRTLSIKLPDDVEEGLAEVIVLVPEAMHLKSLSVEEFLTELSKRPHRMRSKEEIDTELLEMRQSWD